MSRNFDFFEWDNSPSLPLRIILKEDFARWVSQLKDSQKNLINSQNISCQAGNIGYFYTAKGTLESAFLIVDPEHPLLSWGTVSKKLSPGVYKPVSVKKLSQTFWFEALRSFAFGCYKFDRYLKSPAKNIPITKIMPPKNTPREKLESVISATFLVRDLVNTPANHMSPDRLEKSARLIADAHEANITVIKGRDLLKENYPLIYAVGKAGEQSPRLVDIRWGNSQHPKVTLVGKGVCFDTGGLNIKGGDGMKLMKKDMGGAAHVLAIAKMIMEANINIHLRVLIPIVENAISRNAYRPSDIITSRQGLTIEVTNTDAEGRLILADALTAACEEQPEIIIDIATLTGAARIALGADLPAFFSNNANLARKMVTCSHIEKDLLWFMPLHQPYKSYMKGTITDLVNSAETSFGGTITAALFLEEFVKPSIPWIHVDTYSFNHVDLPGRPKGGEAMGMRTIFRYIAEKYSPPKV